VGDDQPTLTHINVLVRAHVDWVTIGRVNGGTVRVTHFLVLLNYANSRESQNGALALGRLTGRSLKVSKFCDRFTKAY
jgi:hypothetical protein